MTGIRAGRRWRAFVRSMAVRLGVAAVAITAGLATATPAQAAIYPIADPDPFYAAPGDIANFKPGDVVRSRQIPQVLFPGSSAWQLVYRSTNSAGDPIAAVTTVLVPPGGGHNQPLVSYQPFINALGLQCAPSHGLFTGEVKESVALNLLLARGWAVTVPDYLGPDSAYGAARMGGRLVLDSARAIKRFKQIGLADSPLALAGYSGGGMVTGFAAALAPDYAPELPIVGTALGGVPENIGKLALDVSGNPNPLFGLGFAGAIGLEREYPKDMSLDKWLNPAGLALRDRMSNACTEQIIADAANKKFTDFFNGTPDDVNATQVHILHANSLETFDGIPRTPIYQWHGTNDVVSPQLVREVVARYCHAGTPIQLDMLPGADHGTGMLNAPRAIDYLADRFAGRPAPSNC
ncbi:secretory lipase [Nocardia pseudobrasiliensis]|uniref:Secretory lipase n=2 Tax=Nocardia pseudobrasiliensis TaxID=45979 RepID=A0A370HYJ3_9NOCA|nr:lipase family protein [Nocardia pseudobrasiliensis]RDI63567.1 secretory lipase [Nocardia pseudobrasiliensis]